MAKKPPAPRIAEQLSFDLGSPAATDTELPSDEDTVPDFFYYFGDSSRCDSAAYDANSRRLYVRFVKPKPVGTPWVYEGVPQNVWRNFRRSSSPGRFVNRTLNDFNNHRADF